jgi:hypothetical protein
MYTKHLVYAANLTHAVVKVKKYAVGKKNEKTWIYKKML